MSSATAVAPPATDPNYRRSLEPSGPPLSRSLSASAVAQDALVSGHSTTASSSRKGSHRVTIILHGKRADEVDVRAAVAVLRSEGLKVDVKVTWESGDVQRFVKDIVKAHSADTIVAAGGDGTLNEVVAALIKVKAPRNIAVGLMPMGTSNDFAAVTGIPQDLESALRLCCRPDNLKQLDVGLLNGEVFMNTATLGASSELGSETSHEAKKLLGPAAYLVKGIARLAGYAAMPVKMRFPAPLESQQPHQKVAKEAAVGAASEGTADAAAAAAGAAATGTASEHQQQPPQPSTDQPHAVRSFSSLSGGRKNQVKGWLSSSWKKTVEVHEEVLNLTAGNSRQVASMLQACPDALLDDGLLDVTYVTGGAVESATALVGEILARGLDGAQPDNVRILRVPWIEVTLEAQDPDLTWPGNRDGEAVPPARKFLLEALPRRIAMHLPEESRELLTEGADPRVNAPVIAIDRMRKGAVRAMVAQVRRFRRIIPGSRPWWQAAAAGLLLRAPFLLLVFVVGYVQGRRAQRRATDGGGDINGDIGRAAASKDAVTVDTVDESKKGKRKGSDAGHTSRSRMGVKVLPFWPIRKARREAEVVG